MVMALVSGLSLALVARGWGLFCLALCAAILASWVVSWRHRFSNRNRLLVQVLVASPFLGSAGLLLSQKPHPVEAAMRLATLGAVYLFSNAVLELYKRPEQARPSVLQFSTLTLMLVGGIGTENPYYHLCLAMYAGAVILFLRRLGFGRSGKSPASRSPLWIVALCFVFALLLSSQLLDSVPHFHEVAMEFEADVMSGEGEGKDSLFGVGTGLWSVENLADSQEIVARVYGPPTLLRGRVGIYYRDGRWFDPYSEFNLFEKVTGRGVFQLPGPVPDRAESWSIEPVHRVDGPLPVPPGTFRLQADVEACRIGKSDEILCETEGEYEVMVAPSQGQDRSLKRLLPETWRWQVYLETPITLEPMLDQAAKKIDPSNRDPAEIARAVEKFVVERGAYGTYDWLQGGTPLENFLLHNSEGGSGFYASAMALILRGLGIPTRFVTGYLVREKNMWGGYYTVRARDAHAWVEVYLGEQGWQAFDPTPSEALSARHPDGTQNWSREALLDSLKVRGQRVKRWFYGRDWARTVKTLFLVLLCIALFRLFLQWRSRIPDTAEVKERARLQSLFQRATRELGQVGLQRRDSETPLELSRRVDSQAMSNWLLDYSELRFGEATEVEIKKLEQALESAVQSLRK